MPKEIVHWLVAERTADRLADTAFGPAVRDCAPCVLLAAVFHDALYYLRGAHPAALRKLPGVLHGQQGEDTYALLRLQLAHAAAAANERERLPRLAALVGLASHIEADIVMHPAVYNLTGNYDDADPLRRTKAVQRHRLMESVMDIAACGGLAGLKKHTLARLLHETGGGSAAALGNLFPLEHLARAQSEPVDRGAEAAFNLFGRLQSLYTHRLLACALYGLRNFLPEAVKELVALFYAPQLAPRARLFDAPVHYRHPVTDAPGVFELHKAMDAAATTAAALCRSLAPALSGGAATWAQGYSLSAGMPGIRAEQLTHYAAPPLFWDF